MNSTEIKYVARKRGDDRGWYGYDIVLDGVEVGHVYEGTGELSSVKWRADVTVNGVRGYATRQSRARATQDAIAHALATTEADEIAREIAERGQSTRVSEPFVGITRTSIHLSGGRVVIVDEPADVLREGTVTLREGNVDMLTFKHRNAIGAGRTLVATIRNAAQEG